MRFNAYSVVTMFFLAFNCGIAQEVNRDSTSQESNLKQLVEQKKLIYFTAVDAPCTIVLSKKAVSTHLKKYGIDFPDDFRFKENAVLVERTALNGETEQGIISENALAGKRMFSRSHEVEILDGPNGYKGKKLRIDDSYLPGYLKDLDEIDWFKLETGSDEVPIPSDLDDFDFGKAMSKPGEGVFNLAKDDWIVSVNGTAGALDGTDMIKLLGTLVKEGYSEVFRVYLVALMLN